MALPVPVLDHVVVNVRDRLDDAAEAYRRLGFMLTPRGYHTLGSMNHLAIFGTDYLELIAAPEGGGENRPEIMAAPFGLNGIVFGTEDSAAVYASLRAAGAAAEAPNEFSRPVELEDGTRRDAVFRTVRLPQKVVPGGRFYFCHHFTPELVWRDGWRRHPNGVVGVMRAVIAAERPEEVGRYFAGLFGADAVRGVALPMGAAGVETLTPAALRDQFGPAAPDAEGRPAYMAALTLRVVALDRTAALLRAAGVAMVAQRDRIVVPAGEAFGAALEFRE